MAFPISFRLLLNGSLATPGPDTFVGEPRANDMGGLGELRTLGELEPVTGKDAGAIDRNVARTGLVF